jgi:hypothetical protein
MCANQPDETLNIGPDEVTLQLGGADVDGLPADRMIVKHFTGQENEVLIFPFEGWRKVVRIALQMKITSTTPAVDAGVSHPQELQDVSDEDEKRFLSFYDRLVKRTYK